MIAPTASSIHHVSRRALPAVAGVIIAALIFASAAIATNATLGASLRTWSLKIGVDAHSVALAAQNRHPRRMVSSAQRFRSDALRARAAIRSQRASTIAGKQAKRLAVVAFTDYAAAGRLWAASGQARLHGQKAAASRYARSATTFAKAGNRFLVRAGRLVR